MKSVLLVKKFLQLVEVTSGLVNASFSFPEWQAVNKNDFLCTLAHPDCSTMSILIFGKPTMNLLGYSACRCVETFETIIDVYLMLGFLFSRTYVKHCFITVWGQMTEVILC